MADRNLWDRLEAAGHDFTYVNGPFAGDTIYYCERCATLMVASMTDGIRAFHAPRECESKHLSTATVDHCPMSRLGSDLEGPTLKSKLEAIRMENIERFERQAE